MPYSCGFERGRLVLKPTEMRTYTISGQRLARPFTTCRAAGDCRTLMVHRFSIRCGSVTVPWVRVAAALKSSAAGRHAYVNGRLLIKKPAEPSALDARPCAELSAKGSTPESKSGDCLPWQPAAPVERIVMPAGFAPVGEIGALFASKAARTPDDPVPTLQRVSSEDGVAALQPVSSEDGAGAATLAGAGNSTLDWVTVVDARDLSEPQGTEAAISFLAALGFAIVLAAGGIGLAWTGYAFVGRSQGGVAATASQAFLILWASLVDAVRGRTGWRGDGREGGGPGDPNLLNAVNTVTALLAQAESSVAGLKAATPLRDVLEEELRLIRRRLAVAKAAALDPRSSAAKIGAQLRGLVFELERVRRIAEGAAASLSGSREAVAMPRTLSEAYAILGVNSDASDGILKKIVDALRMTWHPDHAKDEDDRRLREARIKQINVAWELIEGKRHAA